MPLEPGQRLGSFDILGLLGSGGMGEVYRAHDRRLGRDVALKVVHSRFVADPDRLARLEREARMLASLNHPGIGGVYELAREDGVPFLVLELVEGRTLAQRLDRGPIPVREALEVGRQIAQALEAAHELGIVHRDLKPANIKIGPGGSVKLLDFGLAKAMDETPVGGGPDVSTDSAGRTGAGAVLGSAPYMSPEQARGEPVDAAADVWAFGCVLYEMLTGRRAFDGATTSDTIASVLTAEPDWTRLPPDCDVATRRLLRHCLRRDRKRRLHDIADARIELEDALAGGDVASGAPPRRRRILPWAIAASALVVAAALALRLAGDRAAPAPRFTPLTFRRGSVPAARFAPDEQTVVYSAAWDGGPEQLYSTRIGSFESRALGIEGRLLAVSRQGDLAVRLRFSTGLTWSGTLARVSLAGGAPRELLEDVSIAAWDPEGRDLAVVRQVNGRTRLDYPIGTVLYEPEGTIVSLRFLPDGRLALLEGSHAEARPFAVSLLDRQGKRTVLSEGWQQWWSLLGWSEPTHEVWFVAAHDDENYALYAVDVSGRVRLVTRMMGDFLGMDLDGRGRVLVNRGLTRNPVMVLLPGETRERDITVREFSVVNDISADGRKVLLGESSREPGRGAVYLSRVDGASAVRLGEGEPGTLSPDGRWALATAATGKLDRLLLLPTASGEPRSLRHPSLPGIFNAAYFPDGQRVAVLAGPEPGRARFYVWDLAGGDPRAISPPDDWTCFKVSPNGLWVAAEGTASGLVLLPTDEGDPEPLSGREAGDAPRGWTADGRQLFVERAARLPVRVDLVDVNTGQRRPWREIQPADRAGVRAIDLVLPTPDGKGYAYSYYVTLHTLYVAEGLR